MKESVAIAKEADAKKEFSPTESENGIHRVRNEPERQLGSLRSVIDNIRSDGGTPSVDSIATELSSMPSDAQRASALLALQRTHGNWYVQRVVAGIQAKLKVGQPNDIYEQEADRVAEQVVRMPEPKVQRQSEEEEMLQAKDLPVETLEVTPNIEVRINAIGGGGQPLPTSTRLFFEPRFGYDFREVRVHTDPRMAETARSLKARAFTVGQKIVFGAGQYQPETTSGQWLLAHELTHVVQQRAGSILKPGIAPSIQRQETPATTAPAVVNIAIQRDTQTAQSTTGTLTVGSHTLYSLELPDRGNAATGVSATASRIPAGTYQAHVRTDAGGGNWRLELEGVPIRTYIQIHTGNRPEDTTGCILPGTSRGADVVNNSVDARNIIRQEINNAGPGATIQITISDPPAAPTSP